MNRPKASALAAPLFFHRAVVMFFATAGLAQAQNAPPPPAEHAAQSSEPTDEIVVRGRRSLFNLRMQVQTARERVWEVFNQINSNDDFDITCMGAARTGTHVKNRVCRPNYANRATSRAGKNLIQRVQRNCDPTSASFGDCFEQALQFGGAEAQAEIGRLANMDKRIDEEFKRLAVTNLDLAGAILEYQEKDRTYEGAVRGRRKR
jgi:hypothetical protein